MTIPQEEAINHIASTPEGKLLVEFLRSVVSKYADVRNIANPTVENVKGSQIACDILENEIISRLNRKQTDNKLTITEEFE